MVTKSPRTDHLEDHLSVGWGYRLPAEPTDGSERHLPNGHPSA